MNSFIEEVITQGSLISLISEHYRTTGAADISNIANFFKQAGMNKVVLTGMGSSLYATQSVLSYLSSNRIPSFAFSSHELSRYQFSQIDPRTLVIAISQSGRSAEVIELVRKARDVTSVVGISNYEDRELNALAQFNLGIMAGPELSITSKTYELTMLILNILARRLTSELNETFWKRLEDLADWVKIWMSDWHRNTQPMIDFVKDVHLFDLLANNTSLATARQLSLAYREGLHNCTAVWELADYAHGQYHSSKIGQPYLAQMFVPDFQAGTKEEKMLNYILNHNGRAMLYTSSEILPNKSLYVVRLPRFEDSLMPMVESPVAETLLGMLFGPNWVKDH